MTVKRKPAPRKAKKKRGAELQAHALEILARLKREYPDAHCELDFETPLQLLVATILSAQCTDKRVNMVTPELFRTYPRAQDLAAAKPEELEDMIRSTGFFQKQDEEPARHVGGGRRAAWRRGSPNDGRAGEAAGCRAQTANVVLGNAFATNEGVVVDTHVGRLAVRLGLTNETDPVKVEQALMKLFPRDDWALLSHLLIFHGRRVCVARAPRCGECVLNDICPSSRV